MKIWSTLQKGKAVEFEGMVYTPEMVLGEERKGLKVSYCTDTRPISSITDFVKDSDLLICEGMYGDDNMINKAIDKKHMLFSEAATLAKNSNSKELWLTHYSPALNEPEEYLEHACEIFENTQLGKDIMNKTLNFE
jgi:ribonuclease Z